MQSGGRLGDPHRFSRQVGLPEDLADAGKTKMLRDRREVNGILGTLFAFFSVFGVPCVAIPQA